MLKPDKSQHFLNMLESNQDLAYDVETNGLRWQQCHVVGYSLSDGKDAYYVPVRHEGDANIDNPTKFEAAMAQIIKKRKKKLVGHNVKFDMHFSQNHGINLGNKVVDTMVMAALLDENRFSYSLENVCKGYPDIPQKKSAIINKYISDKFGVPTKNAMGHYYRLSGDDPIAVEYAEGDTLSTYCLYEKQKHDLYAQELDVVVGLENELTYVLQKMERKGVKIDLEELGRLKPEIEELQLEAYKEIPVTEDLELINVKSSKDLEKYFRYLNITDWPVTEKGNPSFNKNYLGTLEEGEAILHARKLDTFMNMFLTPIDQFIHLGRVNTTYNQTMGEYGGTGSGRLSCFGPNMQQIPKRDKFIGKKFRKVFIPDEDFLIIEFDYSQAEPRLFSHYSGEPILIEGYNKTPFIDMHSIAADYMGIERGTAKSLNLGMMYAMGVVKLAIQLGITVEEARKIVKKWYGTFRKVGSFTKAAAERAEARGYVKTILGRRARFNDLRFSYRAANRIVQGGSADILKWKMVELNRWIEQNGYDDYIQILLNIHDSVVVQIHKDYLELIPEIKSILERVQCAPFNLKVPFVAEYLPEAINWSEASYGT